MRLFLQFLSHFVPIASLVVQVWIHHFYFTTHNLTCAQVAMKVVKNIMVVVFFLFFFGFMSYDDLVQVGFSSCGTSVFQCDYKIYGRDSICDFR